jgi:hypothetical protein
MEGVQKLLISMCQKCKIMKLRDYGKKVSPVVKWGWGREGTAQWRAELLLSMGTTNNKNRTVQALKQIFYGPALQAMVISWILD